MVRCMAPTFNLESFSLAPCELFQIKSFISNEPWVGLGWNNYLVRTAFLWFCFKVMGWHSSYTRVSHRGSKIYPAFCSLNSFNQGFKINYPSVVLIVRGCLRLWILMCLNSMLCLVVVRIDPWMVIHLGKLLCQTISPQEKKSILKLTFEKRQNSEAKTPRSEVCIPTMIDHTRTTPGYKQPQQDLKHAKKKKKIRKCKG